MSHPPLLAEIPYREDSSPLFAPLAARPWAQFLDSGASGGRYDLLVADPYVTLETIGGTTCSRYADGRCEESREDPLSLLSALLGEPLAGVEELPFCGGALGSFSYELGRAIEGLGAARDPAEPFPQLAVGLYDWALVVDHQRRRSRLVGMGRDPRTVERWPALIDTFTNLETVTPGLPLRRLSELETNLDRDAYGEGFRRLQRYIRDGDTYQVNYARRFRAAVDGDPWAAYRRLREINPVPFGAYLNLPRGQVLCASPERFLLVEGGQVETRPIKGTRPRMADPVQDAALREELRHSPKDRAENLMIVDLLRNDLGKSCKPGSVLVSELFEVESFPSVHHLVSTVRGELRPEETPLSLLRGSFPGGSITGAPKHRAMQIIDELEPHSRSLYCGAIGYLSFHGRMDTNIAIRTLLHHAKDGRGEVRFWAGGGIVADSGEQAEFDETLHKAAPFFRLLER